MYVIEASETLTPGSWRQMGGAVTATPSRIFGEDNGRASNIRLRQALRGARAPRG